MASLTLQIDNETLFNNLRSVLKLMKGVTVMPAANEGGMDAYSRASHAKRTKDISGIGGAWASEDFPTPDEIYAMRKSEHKIAEL